MVNFEYAFGEPHRITLSRPSAGEKTLVTVRGESARIEWSWGDLKDKFPLSWTAMPIDVKTELRLYADGKPAAFNRWERARGGAPMPVLRGEAGGLAYAVSMIAAKGGVVIRLDARNGDTSPREFCAVLTHKNGWVVGNKGWIDGVNTDVLLTMNNGRADRVLAVGLGADGYPLPRESEASGVPMANADEMKRDGINYPKSMLSLFRVGAGESKTGHIFLPYKGCFGDMDKIRALDCEKLAAAAKREWDALLARGARYIIPDADAAHCYNACLADLFVMRERMAGGYTGVSPGTEIYRSPNSGEGAIAALALDQAGYGKEARSDMRVYFDGQDEDGCWATSKGWEHECWGSVYFKASLAMEHYKLTRDGGFLRDVYKRMRRAALWNGAARERTRRETGENSPFYGLMPRGMGDCGMMNGPDYYGVFYPTNCLAVAADGLALDLLRIAPMSGRRSCTTTRPSAAAFCRFFAGRNPPRAKRRSPCGAWTRGKPTR